MGLAIAADSPDDFESPPDQAPAALLPASMVAGTNYHVVDPVRSDGLMRTYVLDKQVWTVRGLRAFRAAYSNSRDCCAE